MSFNNFKNYLLRNLLQDSFSFYKEETKQNQEISNVNSDFPKNQENFIKSFLNNLDDLHIYFSTDENINQDFGAFLLNFNNKTNSLKKNKNESYNFTKYLDDLYIFDKLEKKFLRYYIVRYGFDNTKNFLLKYKNYKNKTIILSELFGITESQIKYEIENLYLKKPLDFILKRHNYIGLLDKRNILDLYNVLECIMTNLNYSNFDVYLELYKINLFSNYFNKFMIRNRIKNLEN